MAVTSVNQDVWRVESVCTRTPPGPVLTHGGCVKNSGSSQSLGCSWQQVHSSEAFRNILCIGQLNRPTVGIVGALRNILCIGRLNRPTVGIVGALAAKTVEPLIRLYTEVLIALVKVQKLR